VSRLRLRSIQAWPLRAPSATMTKSAPLRLMRSIVSSPLSASIGANGASS
jgi:hypothetical protein